MYIMADKRSFQWQLNIIILHAYGCVGYIIRIRTWYIWHSRLLAPHGRPQSVCSLRVVYMRIYA